MHSSGNPTEQDHWRVHAKWQTGQLTNAEYAAHLSADAADDPGLEILIAELRKEGAELTLLGVRYPNRIPMFRRLTDAEKITFREAGRSTVEEVVGRVNGHLFSIEGIHHPEYRIGALKQLLLIAEAEARLVDTKPYEGTTNGGLTKSLESADG